MKRDNPARTDSQTLEVNDLYKSYGDLDVLKGVSLSASQGDD